jgi:general secretion pathway protein M
MISLSAGSPFSRLAAVVLLIALFAVLYGTVVRPINSAFQSRDQEIQQSLDLLQRFQGEDFDTASLEQRRERLKREAQVGSGLLRGATPAIAAAALQQFIGTAVQAERGTLRSVQILPPADRDGFRRVALRAQVDLTSTALRNLLYRIETSRPFLFVNNLDVRPGQQIARTNQGENDPVLAVRFDFYGIANAVED